MKFGANTILLGVVIGLIVPFVGYAILLSIYDWMDAQGYISDVGMSPSFRERTLALLALCFNLIPFIIFNRQWQAQSMRGLIFPTILYAILWVIFFSQDIL